MCYPRRDSGGKDGVKQDNDCQDNGVRQGKDSVEVTEGEINRAELQGSRNSGCHLKSKSVQTSCRHSLVNNEFSLDPNSKSFELKLKI